MTKPSRSKVALYCSNVMASLPVKLQDADRVAAVDLLLNLIRQIQRVEQLELRHLLAGHQKVGAEEQAVGPAEDELPAKLRIAGNGAVAARLGQVAVEVGVLAHQPVEGAAGGHQR